MVKVSEIKILSVEEKNNRLHVVFEAPGEEFGQDYPKRLAHNFPLKESMFRETSDGEKVYVKKLRKIYVKPKQEQERNKDTVMNKVEKARTEDVGRRLG